MWVFLSFCVRKFLSCSWERRSPWQPRPKKARTSPRKSNPLKRERESEEKTFDFFCLPAKKGKELTKLRWLKKKYFSRGISSCPWRRPVEDEAGCCPTYFPQAKPAGFICCPTDSCLFPLLASVRAESQLRKFQRCLAEKKKSSSAFPDRSGFLLD